MAKVLACLLAFCAMHATGQTSRPEVPEQINSVKWLIGNWERTNVKVGMKANEKWHLATPGELTGLGVTMRGNDIVFLEKIRIIEKENNLYYVADVKENAAPVYFKFTALTAGGFVCENPEHDFPTKIEYKLSDPHLTVTISGGNKSQTYHFVRIE